MNTEDHMEDLRSRVVNIEHRFTEFTPRMTALELRLNQKDVADAETKVILANLVSGVDTIKGGISKILWSVGGAVLLAVVGFVLSGGLVKAKEVASTYGHPSMTVRSFSPSECPVEKPIHVAAYCRSSNTFTKPLIGN